MSLRRISLGALAAAVLMGCGSNDANPDYEQKVTLTPEQQAAEKTIMGGQSAPGAAPGSTAPATMPMPAGKGGR